MIGRLSVLQQLRVSRQNYFIILALKRGSSDSNLMIPHHSKLLLILEFSIIDPLTFRVLNCILILWDLIVNLITRVLIERVMVFSQVLSYFLVDKIRHWLLRFKRRSWGLRKVREWGLRLRMRGLRFYQLSLTIHINSQFISCFMI